ncbi:hypothetical protein V2I01_36325 [Micromonospora sp. BRA006-A]|nr:hypothetical protein [Micromonospora sp. BRA006-A]
MLSERTGEAIGSVSYHVGKLAEHGFVAEAPELARDRRERWWRAAHATTDWDPLELLDDPERRLAGNMPRQAAMQRYVDRYQAYLDSEASLDPAWVRGTTSSDMVLRLTPEELVELRDEPSALGRRRQERGAPGRSGAEMVTLIWQAYRGRSDPRPPAPDRTADRARRLADRQRAHAHRSAPLRADRDRPHRPPPGSPGVRHRARGARRRVRWRTRRPDRLPALQRARRRDLRRDDRRRTCCTPPSACRSRRCWPWSSSAGCDTPGQTARTALLPEAAAAAGCRSSGRSAGPRRPRGARMIGAPVAGLLVGVFWRAAGAGGGRGDVRGVGAGGGAAGAASAEPVRRGERAGDRRLLAAVRRRAALPGPRAAAARHGPAGAGDEPVRRGQEPVLLPVVADRELGGPAAFGLLVGVMGGGALAGSLVFSAIGHRPPRRATFVTAYVLCGAPPLRALAAAPPLPVVVAVVAVASWPPARSTR